MSLRSLSTARTYGSTVGSMATRRPLGPLKFKTKDRESVFKSNAVQTAVLTYSEYSNRWFVVVNSIEVFSGRETAARKQYERALRYI